MISVIEEPAVGSARHLRQAHDTDRIDTVFCKLDKLLGCPKLKGPVLPGKVLE